MSVRVADVYARSLFEVAEARGLVDRVGADLTILRRLLDAEPGLGTYLASPCFTAGQKQGLLIRVFGTVLDPLTRRFLAVLVARGRAGVLGLVADTFLRQWDRHRGVEPVSVTVARPLEAARRDRLEQEVRASLRSEVALTVTVDPALLGGVRIRTADRLIDNSLRGRLDRAAQRLNQRVQSAQFGA